MATEFKLPNLGEHIESGDVVGVLVQVGDRVEEHQPILELETDKAVVEVPVSVSGVVETIHVKQGDQVSEGQVILTLATDGAAAKAETKSAPSEKAPAAQTEPQKEPEPKQREPTAASAKPAPSPAPAEVLDFSPKTPEVSEGRVIPASPSVRRLAREIGVDIQDVSGSGPKGRISKADVKEYSRRTRGTGSALPSPAAEAPLPDFQRWGTIRSERVSGVRRKTAEHMSRSWLTVPHVTHHDRSDVTELEDKRRRYGAKAEAEGGKLTLTAIVIKLLASALKVFPKFNASLDLANQSIIYKEYIHIGVAVDTPRGLLVPVIRDVDQKNILQLAVELKEIAQKARDAKLSLEEMQGGTFTVTNLGGIGGSSFTPIVNWPEVAILGLSRSRSEPEYREGAWEPRTILPLSLSYDHRIIDGAEAARFLRWLAQALEDPFLVSLEG